MLGSVPIDWIVFIVASFVGVMVAGIAGFTLGLIASAIWLHAFTPSQSAALIAAFAIVIQSSTLWKLRHSVQLSRLLPLILGGAIGIPIGAEVLRWATPAQMRAFIGVALVLFSVYSLARPKLPTMKGGRVGDGLVGIASGFFGGSTGLAGIPVIVWSTLRGWSRDEQRAVFQPVAVAVFMMTLLWFGGSGMVTTDTIRLFMIGLPAVLLGTWLGFKLYGKLHEGTFRTIVLVLLLICGVSLQPSGIWTAVSGVAR